jgi:23S rRNA pseudouridine2605 synthase
VARGLEGCEDQGEEPSERLQKVLARAGFGSRRACEEIISAGRVRVNGELATLGRRVNVTSDSVAVDGVRIGVLPGLVHYLLNKPRGVMTTADDPQGRPTVTELVPDNPRVFPVGRLDADSEGLLFMTNDGELAQRLTHPSFGVEKEYLAQVEGVPGRAALRLLRNGVDLEDGLSAPARVGVVGDARDGVLRIVVHEGRNRQVRRMCDAIGHPVRRLVRVRVGPIALRDLGPGAWRELSAKEVRSLSEAAGPGAGRVPRGCSEATARGGRHAERSARRRRPG